MAKYWICYRGVKAERHLTRRGAEARSFVLTKLKSWDINLVDIKVELPEE